nr:immunoglobulin light chain junction region [Macaca mulatta]MOV34745.1 immunoglobulin light chain junction region [Macaca mulatta]MOV76763.1 immunoglobulin light chain junction region [Macaca mulatta]
CTQGLEFPYSF